MQTGLIFYDVYTRGKLGNYFTTINIRASVFYLRY